MTYEGALYELFFYCQNCNKELKPKQLKRCDAYCSKCRSSTWIIYAVYVESEEDLSSSFVGMVSGAVTGIGWRTFKEEYTEYKFDNVSRPEALSLLEDSILGLLLSAPGVNAEKVKNYLKQRVIEYSKAEREKDGHQYCRVCDSLFNSAQDRTWIKNLCCSWLCLSKFDPEIADQVKTETNQIVISKEKKMGTTLDKISVCCSANHSFDVLNMYAGGIRKCPECGLKVDIPQL